MKKLLIVKLSSIGDVLHALPIVKSIKDDLPDLSVGWVVRQRCAGLLNGCPFIDRVFVIKDRPGLADLIVLRSKLCAEGYDTAFDMQGLLLSGIVTALSGAKRRVGLNRNREMNTLFLTDSTVEGKKKRHAIDILLGFREKAGLQQKADIPAVSFLGGSSEDWWTGYCSADLPGIVLNVGASTVYKRWPPARWAEVGRLLIGNGYRIAITAGPSETADADLIAGLLDSPTNVVNLAGKTTQDQLAAVFKAAKLVISGDTGPLHLAVTVGTPTVALFGPTDPGLTGPYGANHTVIWKHIECSPCFRHPTCNARVDCLKAITAEEVAQAAFKILAHNTFAGAIG